MGISQLTEPFEPFKPCICIGLRVLLPPILTYSYLFPYLVIGYSHTGNHKAIGDKINITRIKVLLKI